MYDLELRPRQPLFPGNRSYITNTTIEDDGLALIIGYAKNFIDTVQPNDFPFGEMKLDMHIV